MLFIFKLIEILTRYKVKHTLILISMGLLFRGPWPLSVLELSYDRQMSTEFLLRLQIASADNVRR